ncbi:tripartite tricarboxylate transporter substrate-binding protein [Halogeometricum luteum]|uniref:Tripartite tricarboxylate transporter substrate-binding protein n=1 Tax=Halogeometricum luteum TaxID=2950537 RepID=A0ABU2G299_9EURY|nr:tripartite tricarboxylate transporter substrate-binding protein [Halogeometricum sp. S3BR5-2]MDS0294905.1 tripartite tricarboxylate transporter substrate-binding protein [Halogeometricum sp. S3BR5-2]
MGGGEGNGNGGDSGGEGTTESSTSEESSTDTSSESGSYPSETITMVVGFGAGGSNDTRYRGFKPYFEEELGGNTIVENRSGASGRTGMNYLYGQDPDGYSLIAQYLPTTILGAALFNTQYDPSELTPMGTVDAGYSLLVAPAGRYEDLSDMMSQLGDSEFTMASTGTGSTTHFSAVSVLDSLGINYREQVSAVPYDSGSEAGAAAASGDVDIAYSSSDLTGLVQDGRIDVLLVDRPSPSPRYPDAPTVNDISEWDIPVVAGEMAIHGPPGVDEANVSVVSDAITAACQNEEYQGFVENNGLSVVGVGAEETRQKMDDLQAAADRYRELTQ